MTFVPVVERELRVAARKRSTFWLRVIAASVALVIGVAFLVLVLLVPQMFGGGTPNVGKGLFTVLTWLCLATVLSAGLFFTSDALSEEKRAGTLGLLFLTDLHGYDVVLGKLLATSLRVVGAILAVFPVLAVTLLMGSVTGAQFWKVTLALLNAMWLSLVAGLFISTLSRDSQRALAGVLALLVFLIAAGPVTDAAVAEIRHKTFNPMLSLSSPGFLFVTADAWGRSPFWTSLILNQAIALLLVSAACVLLPRTWQDKASASDSAFSRWLYRERFGATEQRLAVRRKWISLNPIIWLQSRERWQGVAAWTTAVVTLSGPCLMLAAGNGATAWWLWSDLAGAITLVLYLGVASNACRFHVEAKRTGFLELLLGTPLPAASIVHGQWIAFLRRFGPPLVLCLAAQLVGGLLTQQQLWKQMSAATPTPPPPTVMLTNQNTGAVLTNLVVSVGSTNVTVAVSASPTPANVLYPFNRTFLFASAIGGTLTSLVNLVALHWFGMWIGLTSKSANLATLKTLAFVQIIPWFVISFASALAIPLLLLPNLFKGVSYTPRTMEWFPLIAAGTALVLSLSKDVFFLLWARRRLYGQFRERALEVLAPVQLALPPVLPSVPPPPVPG